MQDEAGQDQQQRLRSHWQTVSWQHSWHSNAISQLAVYRRSSSSALLGSPFDTPLFTNANRTLRRFGVLGSVTYQRGPHVLKSSAEASRLFLREDFRFSVTDPDGAEESELSPEAISHTLERPFVFHEAARPTLLSFYLQDSIRATGRLTIDLVCGVTGAFTPDHDQRNVGAVGLTHERERRGLALSLSGRYESGTPLQVAEDEIDELSQRPGGDLVDLARGRVKPRMVFDLSLVQRLFSARRVELNARAAVLNLTGRRWAYNFGNPFSGTHFGPGRTFQVGLRAVFR